MASLLELVMESMIAQAAKHPELLSFATQQHSIYGRGALVQIFSSSSAALSATSYEYKYCNAAVAQDIGSERIDTLLQTYVPGREYVLLYGITITQAAPRSEYDTVFNGCIMRTCGEQVHSSGAVLSAEILEEASSSWGTCLRKECTARAVKWCSECKDANYCSPCCQQTDWPAHRVNCEEAARCRKAARLMMRRMLC